MRLPTLRPISLYVAAFRLLEWISCNPAFAHYSPQRRSAWEGAQTSLQFPLRSSVVVLPVSAIRILPSLSTTALAPAAFAARIARAISYAVMRQRGQRRGRGSFSLDLLLALTFVTILADCSGSRIGRAAPSLRLQWQTLGD